MEEPLCNATLQDCSAFVAANHTLPFLEDECITILEDLGGDWFPSAFGKLSSLVGVVVWGSSVVVLVVVLVVVMVVVVVLVISYLSAWRMLMVMVMEVVVGLARVMVMVAVMAVVMVAPACGGGGDGDGGSRVWWWCAGAPLTRRQPLPRVAALDGTSGCEPGVVFDQPRLAVLERRPDRPSPRHL